MVLFTLVQLFVVFHHLSCVIILTSDTRGSTVSQMSESLSVCLTQQIIFESYDQDQNPHMNQHYDLDALSSSAPSPSSVEASPTTPTTTHYHPLPPTTPSTTHHPPLPPTITHCPHYH